MQQTNLIIVMAAEKYIAGQGWQELLNDPKYRNNEDNGNDRYIIDCYTGEIPLKPHQLALLKKALENMTNTARKERLLKLIKLRNAA